MLQWLKSLMSPQPAGPPALLHRFGPADPTVTTDGVVVEADRWRIDSTGERTVHLFEVPVSGLERCMLIYRAQLSIPGRGESYSKGFQHAVAGDTEWATCETPYFLKAGERADLVKLNVVCAGTIWIRRIELLHTPLR